ncbi:hypothetical protein AVEN_183504-1 [Araneus ventricosus]|uniref:Uncharacterized protein n=1 Tax=Araneus ventricosus TaxID=182803 RepID=A0A4Y2NCK6_ARAVE|nr:hypothetical protein AVEN_183504-1 [Araneus ventricosus]
MWISFALVVKNFLGNHKTDNNVALINNKLNFGDIFCNMNIKVYNLYSDLDHFPEILGNTSEEHGERFDHDKENGGVIPGQLGYSYGGRLPLESTECVNKVHSKMSNKSFSRGTK